MNKIRHEVAKLDAPSAVRSMACACFSVGKRLGAGPHSA